MLTFGLVPSRRLGRSLGINNIPPKICTYSCVYCQVGNTIKMRVKRQNFFKPFEILKEVKKKIEKVDEVGEKIVDYKSMIWQKVLDILQVRREVPLGKRMGQRLFYS